MACNYCGSEKSRVKTALGHEFCCGNCKDSWLKWVREFLINARTKEREELQAMADAEAKKDADVITTTNADVKTVNTTDFEMTVQNEEDAKPEHHLVTARRLKEHGVHQWW